jgi:hypothetical protein
MLIGDQEGDQLNRAATDPRFSKRCYSLRVLSTGAVARWRCCTSRPLRRFPTATVRLVAFGTISRADMAAATSGSPLTPQFPEAYVERYWESLE